MRTGCFPTSRTSENILASTSGAPGSRRAPESKPRWRCRTRPIPRYGRSRAKHTEGETVAATATTAEAPSIEARITYLAPGSFINRRFVAPGREVNTGEYLPYPVIIHDARPREA